jgi:hypothetical protein
MPDRDFLQSANAPNAKERARRVCRTQAITILDSFQRASRERIKVMPSRRKGFSKAKARGSRTDVDYSPWFFTADVPSRGTSSVLTGRQSQEHPWLLFDKQQACFRGARRRDDVIEIRDRYPLLPLEEVIAIAQKMGVRGPKRKGDDLGDAGPETTREVK